MTHREPLIRVSDHARERARQRLGELGADPATLLRGAIASGRVSALGDGLAADATLAGLPVRVVVRPSSDRRGLEAVTVFRRGGAR